MAPLVALSLCTAALSLRGPAMNAVIDGRRRHPCLTCLWVFRGRSLLELMFCLIKFSGDGCSRGGFRLLIAPVWYTGVGACTVARVCKPFTTLLSAMCLYWEYMDVIFRDCYFYMSKN